MTDENEQEGKENEQEGMSTGKKVVAGAAIGVAVPAAVGVAKKLLGNGDDKQQGVRSEVTGRAKAGTARAKRAGSSAAETVSGAARKGTSSRRAAGKARSTTRSAASKARSTARSAGSRASRGGGRTKEQLYQQAKRLNIEGRSSMTKAQLERAISRKRS